MNIQRKNSAYHFHMQSEREQTLAIYLYVSAIIGRAKGDPHWGVQSRFRVIYVYDIQ